MTRYYVAMDSFKTAVSGGATSAQHTRLAFSRQRNWTRQVLDPDLTHAKYLVSDMIEWTNGTRHGLGYLIRMMSNGSPLSINGQGREFFYAIGFEESGSSIGVTDLWASVAQMSNHFFQSNSSNTPVSSSISAQCVLHYNCDAPLVSANANTSYRFDFNNWDHGTYTGTLNVSTSAPGTFAVGDVIQGATSGCKAIVLADNTTNLSVGYVLPAFTNGAEVYFATGETVNKVSGSGGAASRVVSATTLASLLGEGTYLTNFHAAGVTPLSSVDNFMPDNSATRCPYGIIFQAATWTNPTDIYFVFDDTKPFMLMVMSDGLRPVPFEWGCLGEIILPSQPNADAYRAGVVFAKLTHNSTTAGSLATLSASARYGFFGGSAHARFIATLTHQENFTRSNYMTPIHATVRVATTGILTGTPSYNSTGGGGSGRITFTSGPTTIDGVTISDGDRILVKNEGSVGGLGAAANGIWVRNSVNQWDRSTDFDNATDVMTGFRVYVLVGTTNTKLLFKLTSTGTIVVGTGSGTALTFAVTSPQVVFDRIVVTDSNEPKGFIDPDIIRVMGPVNDHIYETYKKNLDSTIVYVKLTRAWALPHPASKPIGMLTYTQRPNRKMLAGENTTL